MHLMSIQVQLTSVCSHLIPVEGRIMLWLAPELLKAGFVFWFCMPHYTVQRCNAGLHCVAGYTSIMLLLYLREGGGNHCCFGALDAH